MWSTENVDDSSTRILIRILEWIHRFNDEELSVGEVAQNLGVVATALETAVLRSIREEVDKVAGDLEVAALTMGQRAQREYGQVQLQQLAGRIREFLGQMPAE